MTPLTPSTLLDQSRDNLARVRGLVDLNEQVAGPSPGRSSVRESDLRSAVVLLHATLEDLLRGVAELRLPHAQPQSLGKIPFGGAKSKDASPLEFLASYRGRTVDEVIAASIASYLDRKTYSNVDEIAALLIGVGLRTDLLLKSSAPRLAVLMTRRHHIAHRLGRNTFTGPGHHSARSLRKDLVIEWIEAVSEFIQATAPAL